jgi:c-di-AMP phosphodiesterase-like protein
MFLMKNKNVSISLLLFLALLGFSCAAFYYDYVLGFAQIAITVMLFFVYKRSRAMKLGKIDRAVSSVSLPGTSSPVLNVLNIPLPACIVRLEDGEILWSNPMFSAITNFKSTRFEVSVTSLVPDFPLKWLMEDKSECPADITISEKTYKVFGALARHDDNTLSALLYWVDITELALLRSEMKLRRMVAGVITLDNYEEITKTLNENQKANLFAALDDRIFAYLQPMNAIFRKYERDRYLIMLEERYLKDLIDDKFSILENVRELTGCSGLPATISIGLGADGANPAETLAFASLATDMALSRGGDQVVVKNRLRFEFFGGKSKEMEKRTKVKSRVMAGALRELMQDASLVLIMGHKQSDIDCIGSACGLMAMARKLGKKSYIVTDTTQTAALKLIEKLSALREYNGAFIGAQSALIHADRETLLVIVDTSRPELVESVELLQSVHHVAVVDHHRRAETYIEQAALEYHEPYASSTCELVTELLQYTIEPNDLLREESEGLLAGITMDTKGFSMHTGVRTFEAAAYLRAAGADTTNIKKMLQTDLSSNLARHRVVSNAEMLNEQVTVAVADTPVDRVTASQAADDLLTISGIQAAFVISRLDDCVHISARSLGDINVQIIAEKLGGGGHQTMAGVQLYKLTEDECKERLVVAVNEYFNERG